MKRFVLLCLMLMGIVACFSQNLPDATDSTKSVTVQPDTSGNFSFLVGGHLYDSRSPHSVLLNPALYANLDPINQSGAAFFVGLGDVLGSTGNSYSRDNFRHFFLESLEIPFHNAPGNHDLIDPQEYQKLMGKGHEFFIQGNAAFFILNSEEYAADTSLEQTIFFEKIMQSGAKWDSIQTIFVFSHRLLWAQGNEAFAEAQLRSNVFNSLDFESDGLKKFREDLSRISKGKSLWWFSGDVGREESYSLFCDSDPENANFHYLATGLGQADHEALLQVLVEESGAVKVEMFPLSGQDSQPVENFDRKWLSGKFEDAPIPSGTDLSGKVRGYFNHPYFRYGFISATIVFSFVILTLVAFKKRVWDRFRKM